jgi:hypothetical protein
MQAEIEHTRKVRAACRKCIAGLIVLWFVALVVAVAAAVLFLKG